MPATPPPPIVAPETPAATELARLPLIVFGEKSEPFDPKEIRKPSSPLAGSTKSLIVDCGASSVSGRLSVLPSTDGTPAPSAKVLPPCTKALAGSASSAAQAHAVPLHLASCPLAQAVVGSNWLAVSVIVPVVLIGPPVRPAPVATLVTVPLPPVLSAAQAQALPFHFGS